MYEQEELSLAVPSRRFVKGYYDCEELDISDSQTNNNRGYFSRNCLPFCNFNGIDRLLIQRRAEHRKVKWLPR
jgi:hypothetical protein